MSIKRIGKQINNKILKEGGYTPKMHKSFCTKVLKAIEENGILKLGCDNVKSDNNVVFKMIEYYIPNTDLKLRYFSKKGQNVSCGMTLSALTKHENKQNLFKVYTNDRYFIEYLSCNDMLFDITNDYVYELLCIIATKIQEKQTAAIKTSATKRVMGD